MKIVQHLCCIAAHQIVGEGGQHLLGMLSDQLSEHSQRLTQALRHANDHAWHTLELALAGDSWWDRVKGVLARSEDRELAHQVRRFLANNDLHQLEGTPEDTRLICLQQLQAARKAGLIQGKKLDTQQLASDLRAVAQRYADPQEQMRSALERVGHIAAELEAQQYAYLAGVLKAQVYRNQSLLVVAVRYYFRREIENDRALFQGLSFAVQEQLAQDQAAGFRALHAFCDQFGDRLDELLDEVKGARQDILDLRAEMQRQIEALGQQHRQQFQEFYQPIIQMLEQLQLQGRPLRASDSVSIRTDHDRQRVEALLRGYLALPEEQKQGRPALLNGLGQLQFAVNDFEGAEKAFEQVARLVPEERAQAEAHHNAYRTALERVPPRLDVALRQLKRAVALDAERFAPFPLEDYELIDILGAGGFGVTFLARHRNSGGEVAIKALTTDGLDRDVQTVFEEASTLEKLEHPAIVRLRDCNFADKTNRQRPYLVMDYFPGPTLLEHVEKNGPMTFADLLPLARQVAEALDVAHARQILHRDVKPANILVQRDPQRRWRVKVIDFGLALKQSVLAGAGSTSRRQHTLQSGSIAGTIDYAAPEQMGKLTGVRIDRPADVYGFARTCLYALFKTPQPRQHHWESLPKPVRYLLDSCLAEHPDERPGSFREVLLRLRGLADEPPPIPKVEKAPPSLPPKLPPPVPQAVAVPVLEVAPEPRSGVRKSSGARRALDRDREKERDVKAKAALLAPGLAMAIVGMFAVLLNLLCFIQGVTRPSEFADTPWLVGFFPHFALLSAFGLASSVFMMRCKAYPFCLVGCGALMLGGMTCFFAGTAVGIWALVVLLRPDVRAAFR
jgi:serine/threonine protein kinase